MLLNLFSIPQAHNFIGGVWLEADAEINVTNPSTKDKITSIARGTAKDIDAAVHTDKTSMSGEWVL